MDATHDNNLKAFFTAVRQNDLDRVQSLLIQDPTLVHEYDEDEFDAPALNIAVSHNNNKMVDILLNAGADPNRKSAWWAGGFHPLHLVIDKFIADRLIARGAVVDACAASKLGMMDRLREILDTNPQAVHERGGDGQFPLHFAATPRIAEFLLERGADIDARDIDHVSTAAQWAVGGRPEVVRHLVGRGAACDLFMLCAAGDVEHVRMFLEKDPGVVCKQITKEEFPSPGSEGGHIYCYVIGMGATPLQAALKYTQLQVADLLFESGADVNAPCGYDDGTPLHFAAWEGRVDAARWLIDHGADIERHSGKIHENTSMGWAIISGHLEIVRLLLERGAVVPDYYIERAKAGERGELREWSCAEAGVYAEMKKLLEERKQ